MLEIKNFRSQELIKYQAFLVLCTQIIYFILNIQSISLEKIMQTLNIKAFQFWIYVLNNLNMENSLPKFLVEHIQLVEELVITKLFWNQKSILTEFLFIIKQTDFHQIQNNKLGSIFDLDKKILKRFFIENNVEKEIEMALDQAVKRILFYCANLIRNITKDLCQKENALEIIWKLNKNIIMKNINILMSRTLEQIVMCCIFSVFKALKINVKF